MAAVIVRPGDTLGSLLRRGLWEWLKEIGPMMLFLLGLCFMGLGGIMHAEGVSNLAYDSHLRSVGVEALGKVVEVQHYHSVRAKGGGSDYYTPVTAQTVDGRLYRTTLNVYEVTNDRDYYKIGQKLHLLYDPADPNVVGIKSSELRQMFEDNISRSGSFFWPGLISFLIGLPLGIVQLSFYFKRRWLTREERGWRKLRHEVKYRRRKARSLQRRRGSKQARVRGRHSL